MTTPDLSNQPDRHDRQRRAFGPDANAALQDSTVAIVGCGGLGSHYVQLLARLGVSELVLVDPDHVETSNLNRLVGVPDTAVDLPKTEVLAAVARMANPDTDVTTIARPVQDTATQLEDHNLDAVLAGVDQMLGRTWLNLFAQDHGLPYIDAGVSIDIDQDDGEQHWAPSGTIQRVVPGESACLECVGRIDWDELEAYQLDPNERAEAVDNDYIAPDTAADLEEADTDPPQPAVVHVNSVVASLAVTMLVRQLTGATDQLPSLVKYDGTTLETTTMHVVPRPGCPACHQPVEDGDPP